MACTTSTSRLASSSAANRGWAVRRPAVAIGGSATKTRAAEGGLERKRREASQQTLGRARQITVCRCRSSRTASETGVCRGAAHTQASRLRLVGAAAGITSGLERSLGMRATRHSTCSSGSIDLANRYPNAGIASAGPAIRTSGSGRTIADHLPHAGRRRRTPPISRARTT